MKQEINKKDSEKNKNQNEGEKNSNIRYLGFSKEQLILVLASSLIIGFLAGFNIFRLTLPQPQSAYNVSAGLSSSDQAALQNQIQSVLSPALTSQGGSLAVSVNGEQAPVANLSVTINGSTQSIPSFVYNNELFLATQGIPLSSSSTASNAQQQTLPPLFNNPPKTNTVNVNQLEGEVIPAQGYVLPVKWGKSAKELVDSGALNITALSSILQQSGQPLTAEELQILNGTSDENITINANNTLFDLYVLWGVGISNNNSIINSGPLMQNGNPNNFASTGGYLPLGNLMIGQLNIMNLSSNEQTIAEQVAFNSYRPCCDNPTGFPDCNHGAAALGLIEIMASQGNSLNATFEAVRDFNSFQFTQQYMEEAVFFASQGQDWNAVPASTVVNYNFSSATGSSYVMQYIQKFGLVQSQGASGSSASCGVGGAAQSSSSSCGVGSAPVQQTQTSSCGV